MSDFQKEVQFFCESKVGLKHTCIDMLSWETKSEMCVGQVVLTLCIKRL